MKRKLDIGKPLDSAKPEPKAEVSHSEDFLKEMGILAEDFEPPKKQEDLEPEEVALDTSQIEQSSRSNMNFFAGLLAPLVFKFFYPTFYQALWAWVIDRVQRTRDFSQIAIGLPRGFGKTMVVKLMVCYFILFTKKRFILILAGTAGKAENIVRDIISMLGERNVRAVFGNWDIEVEKDRQDEKIFNFRGRTIILKGAGAGSDIRGITVDNHRPDIMIFDDIQTREEANSPEVSNKLEEWMYGTAMKAKSASGCLFIFIANMYPTDWSLLKRIKYNPEWEKVIAGGILADGASLWEELQPITQLLKEYRNDKQTGRPEVFHAEVLNDDKASNNKHLDTSLIPVNPYGDDEVPQGMFVVIDPATDKQNADANSIGLVKVYDGKPLIRSIEEGKFSPKQVAARAIQMCLTSGCRVIFVEDVAYQYVLAQYINEKIEELGISGIVALGLPPKGGSKNTRIVRSFPMYMDGSVLFHEETKNLILDQALNFNSMITKNVDGLLDLVTMSIQVIGDPELRELIEQFDLNLADQDTSDSADMQAVCLF